MPKNAVQRLQKIDKDIKTVLSIYELANSAIKNHDQTNALHFSKISPSKYLDNFQLLENLRERSRQSPSFLSDPFQQIGTLLPPFEERVPPHDPPIGRQTFCVLKKPSSAPSSSSTLSTICESDHKCQQSSESLKDIVDRVESCNFEEDYNLLMGCDNAPSPSKETLGDNNYGTPEKSDELNDETENLGFLQLVPSVSENAKEPQKEEDSIKVKEAPKKRDIKSSIKSKVSKMRRDDQKEKTVTEHSASVPDKDHKLESKVKFKFRSKTKESMERLEKGWSISRAEEKSRSRRKTPSAERQEKKSRSVSKDKERKEQRSPSTTQRTRKSPERDGAESRANELSKIIEKSNEKMEKMKASKELALDIAKQLKDKYDKIQHSKDELMEKLQTSEKNNVRLHNEIKNAQESQAKLQLKMEGLTKTSKTKLQEQELKIKEVLERNAWLAAKLAEMEKNTTEKLLEKQTEIERLQKERLSEIKNQLKNRENRSGEVNKLIGEKNELAKKVEGLQSGLKDRQAKVESLETKILQLQEEIQKQKEKLMEKTERLEGTNRELESIRQNSDDLEEQVKTLRKNIENFENLHKNLMKDHDQQMKMYQEKIQTLENEKSKLASELENKTDALLIKDKIIDDQQETIKKLREKIDESKPLIKRNQSLERVLEREREEKLELQEAVERLKWRKEELKGRIKSLESDLLLAPQEVVRDLQKTQMVLHELEHQVQTKQKEWEVQLQTVIREKEQACSVAEFATKKLMQTTSEFQKQSEVQKRLHRALAETLAEKERHLREATERLTKSGK